MAGPHAKTECAEPAVELAERDFAHEGTMVRSACQLHLTIERTAADLLLMYDVEDWRARCRCADRGTPALCENLRPTILQLLAQCKNASLGTGEQREG
jgi:hypothetical protein